jgi:predicted phosphodiesterase
MIFIKYALISDIHGNLPALEAVMQDTHENNVDYYIFLGDYCVGLAYPNEILDYIRSIEKSFVVSGNEDDLLVHLSSMKPDEWPKGQYEAGSLVYKSLSERNRGFLSGLPQELIIERDDCPSIFIFHKPQKYFSNTSPASINPHFFAKGMDEKRFNFDTFFAHSTSLLNDDAQLHSIISKLENGVYIFGHTHIPLYWEHEGKLLINPGSCGLPLDFNPSASYAILEWRDNTYTGTLKRIKYDINATINHIKKSDYAKDVRVWSGVITLELKTAREQAVPFILFAEKYATDKHDMVRPFNAETWYSAYKEWCK